MDGPTVYFTLLIPVLLLAFILYGNNRVIDQFAPPAKDGAFYLFWKVWVNTAWKSALLSFLLSLCSAPLLYSVAGTSIVGTLGAIPGAAFGGAVFGICAGLFPAVAAGFFYENKTKSKIAAASVLVLQIPLVIWSGF